MDARCERIVRNQFNAPLRFAWQDKKYLLGTRHKTREEQSDVIFRSAVMHNCTKKGPASDELHDS